MLFIELVRDWLKQVFDDYTNCHLALNQHQKISNKNNNNQFKFCYVAANPMQYTPKHDGVWLVNITICYKYVQCVL